MARRDLPASVLDGRRDLLERGMHDLVRAGGTRRLAQHPLGPAQRADDRALDLDDVAGDPELHEGLATQQRVRAAEERRVPAVLALLDGTVEQFGLAAQGIAFRHIAEVLRGLHERDPFVGEVAERSIEDLGRRYLIGVEHEQELPARRHERVVEVARLGVSGMPVPRRAAGDVSDAERRGGALQLRPRPVVEQPGGVRVPDRLGGGRRREHEFDGLVVGRYEHVDRQARCGRRRVAATPRAPHGEAEEADVDEAVGLGDHERQRDPPGLPVQREQPPPGDVVDAEHERRDDDDAQQREARRRGRLDCPGWHPPPPWWHELPPCPEGRAYAVARRAVVPRTGRTPTAFVRASRSVRS